MKTADLSVGEVYAYATHTDVSRPHKAIVPLNVHDYYETTYKPHRITDASRSGLRLASKRTYATGYPMRGLLAAMLSGHTHRPEAIEDLRALAAGPLPRPENFTGTVLGRTRRSDLPITWGLVNPAFIRSTWADHLKAQQADREAQERSSKLQQERVRAQKLLVQQIDAALKARGHNLYVSPYQHEQRVPNEMLWQILQEAHDR